MQLARIGCDGVEAAWVCFGFHVASECAVDVGLLLCYQK